MEGRFTEGLLGNFDGRYNGPKLRAVEDSPWLGGILTKLLSLSPRSFYQGGGGYSVMEPREGGEAEGPGHVWSWGGERGLAGWQAGRPD